MRVIFMGTPAFSCPTLEKIYHDKNFQIVGIYTKEPQVANRGQKITKSAIHELALKYELPIFTPKTLKSSEVQKEFQNLAADLAVVVAYGLILPKEILNGTKFGCINIHPSLLPRWRGAAPIQRTIMAGDKESGIAIIKMDEGLDSGDIIYQEKFALADDVLYSQLAQKMAQQGAEILVKVLHKIKVNDFSLTPQNHEASCYANKLSKEECEINWQNSAIEIDRKIRALSGSLGAYFTINNEKIKIFKCEIIDQTSSNYKAGEIIDNKLSIQCGQGIIRPLILQKQGKKVMSLDDFLLGHQYTKLKIS